MKFQGLQEIPVNKRNFRDSPCMHVAILGIRSPCMHAHHACMLAFAVHKCTRIMHACCHPWHSLSMHARTSCMHVGIRSPCTHAHYACMLPCLAFAVHACTHIMHACCCMLPCLAFVAHARYARTERTVAEG